MTEKPSYAQRLKEQRESLFVGRQEEREALRRNFGRGVPEHPIFVFHGQAGMGKSFLAARYQDIARENGALAALTNEAEATTVREQSILQAMARLAEQLADADAPLKDFDKRYKKYRECMQEVEADPDAPQGAFDLLGRTTARLALGGIKMTPAGQAASGFLQDVGVKEEIVVEQAGIWASYLARKFKNKDKVVLVKEPVETLTPLFIQDLNKIAKKRSVVLCFDTWERTEPHLGEWLRRLIDQGELSTGVWFVIAGRHLPSDEWQPLHPLMACFELHEFTEEETREYLKQWEITDEARVEQILAFSGGVPVLVSLLASAKGGSASDTANGLVDRYLKWIDNEQYRKTALRCAAARRLDKDVVAAVMGDDNAGELFDWLSQTPFVQSRPGYWEYHPKVRRMMMSFTSSRSLKDSRATHANLQAYYRDLLAEKGESPRYSDPMWRRCTLEALYHGLMQESAEAEQEGLEAFLLALRKYRSFVGEITATWQQAAEEQEADNQVSRWAEILGTGWAAIESKSWKDTLPCYEMLQKREGLSDTARGVVHVIGGATYATLQDYKRTIANFDRAIELEPEYARAYYNRGGVYANLQDYEHAIVDYGRAIELDPKDARAYHNRGVTYVKLQDYEHAIADFDRAIELDLEDAMVYHNRGATYLRLQDYEHAIADFDRAIELNPEDARVYRDRELVYATLHPYERTIANCDRAIELNPQNATAYNNRGNAYVNSQEYERAIADYDRAIELEPEYAAAYNNRGIAYVKLQDYGRAIADFDRAIKLDSEHTVAYYNTACVYAMMGRTKKACEWLKKAIELDESLRKKARTDEDFDGIRGDEGFRALVGEE